MGIHANELAELGYELRSSTPGTYSALMRLPDQLPAAEIVARLGEAVTAKGTAGELLPVAGFIPASPTEATDTVLFTCDPAPNLNNFPDVQQSASIVPAVVGAYCERYGHADFDIEPIGADFRAICGLTEGESKRKHSPQEAASYLPLEVRDKVSIAVGSWWSARYRPDHPELLGYEYGDGMDIRGPAGAMAAVLGVASVLRQNRIVFEVNDVETQVYHRLGYVAHVPQQVSNL